VCLADGRKIPLDDYREQSKEVIRGIAPASLSDLLKLWIDKTTRRDLRTELKDRDVHVAAFRHFLDLDETDDVDILAKVGFDLFEFRRHDRVAVSGMRKTRGCWPVGEQGTGTIGRVKSAFWQTSLTIHYME
jgi:type I restriction enzyme R subunit